MFKKIMILSLLALASCGPATVEANCVGFVQPGWDQFHKNTIGVVAGRIVGVEVTVTWAEAAQINFTLCSSANLSSLTLNSLAAEQTTFDNEIAAAAAAETAKQAGFTTELGNSICNASISEIDAAIDGAIDPAGTLAAAKTAMKVILKKMAKCMVAMRGRLL